MSLPHFLVMTPPYPNRNDRPILVPIVRDGRKVVVTVTETTTRGPRGPYAKSADRRAQILAAALQLFSRRGFHGTSMREIATAAGISLSTLTHHFPAKEQVLLAVLQLRDEISPEPDDASTLAESVLAQARRNESVPGLVELYTLITAEATSPDHPAREWSAHRFAGLRATYRRHFETLAAAGRLAAGVSPTLAASWLVALWDGLQTQWLIAPDEIDVGAGLRDFFALVLIEAPDADSVRS